MFGGINALLGILIISLLMAVAGIIRELGAFSSGPGSRRGCRGLRYGNAAEAARDY